MENFKEVSLGFAEFVSQLIQETFDAIMSSQNYQLERYTELESKLNMPNSVFIENYISNEEINSRKHEYFGVEIKKQMTVDEDLKQFLNNNFESNQNLVFNKKLTNAGFNTITTYISNLLVEERKSMLNTLINNSNVSNIVVDSGEITAKFELTNLFQKKENIVESTRFITEIADASRLDRLRKKNINIIDFIDQDTGKTTVLIDKNTIGKIDDLNFEIPNVRLSVQPTKLTGSSDLFSEVKINFKTI